MVNLTARDSGVGKMDMDVDSLCKKLPSTHHWHPRPRPDYAQVPGPAKLQQRVTSQEFFWHGQFLHADWRQRNRSYRSRTSAWQPVSPLW